MYRLHSTHSSKISHAPKNITKNLPVNTLHSEDEKLMSKNNKNIDTADNMLHEESAQLNRFMRIMLIKRAPMNEILLVTEM